jgi:structure-specific endonuclease subunit SLX1
MSFVYLLQATNNSTYVGATINLEKRLRQHNKEIKGGARATSIKVEQGEIWERACYIEGFPDWQAALQFEWRWKQISRKLQPELFPLKRRMMALKKLLELESSTSKAIPYSEWETPPNIIFESEKAKDFYINL